MWVNALKTRQVGAEYEEYGSRSGIIIISKIIFYSRAYQIISKNPKELAIELCLASVDDETIRSYYRDKGMTTCDEISFTTKRSSRRKIGKITKKKNKKSRKFKNKKNGRKASKDKDKISGSSVYLSDIQPVITSRHHPWQCSLRSISFSWAIGMEISIQGGGGVKISVIFH